MIFAEINLILANEITTSAVAQQFIYFVRTQYNLQLFLCKYTQPDQRHTNTLAIVKAETKHMFVFQIVNSQRNNCLIERNAALVNLKFRTVPVPMIELRHALCNSIEYIAARNNIYNVYKAYAIALAA